MMYKEDVEKLQSDIKQMKENGELYACLGANMNLAEEQGIDDYTVTEVLAFYLINCHDTITKIACNCGTLSKSTYDYKVYIEDILDHQEYLHNRMIKEDIYDILDDKDYDAGEKLMHIMGYIDTLRC